MNQEQPVFPREIHSPRLGVFVLDEWTTEHPPLKRGAKLIETVDRVYNLKSPVPVDCARVKVNPEGMSLWFWPPEGGIQDVVVFVHVMEGRWSSIMGRLGAILDASLPVIDDAIGQFWGIPDTAPPTAEQLLATSVVNELRLSVDLAEHTLYMFDEGNLIGGHDILLHLHPDGSPSHAGFDG